MLSALSEIFHLQQDDATLRLYDRAMAATSCGIVISDATRPDIPIIYCNPAFERITGYSRQEVLGYNCRFLQGSDTDPTALMHLRTCLREERECQVVLKNYRKDGTPFWNELTISPVRDASGRLTHYIGVQTDITERVTVEEQARLMQFSLDRAGDAAFWMTPDARFFYVNEAACRTLGYSREELLKLNVQDIDPDFPSATWLQPWEAIKKQGSFTIETRYRTKQGYIFPVEVTLNYLEFKGQEYYCAFARDISERKRSEAALKQSETRLRLALNAASMGVWDWDLLTNQGTWCENAASLFGLSSSSLTGAYEVYLNGIHPEDKSRVEKAIARVLETGTDLKIEHRVLRPDGICWLAVRGAVFCDHTGKPLRMMGTVMDITERQQAEAALIRSEELYRTLAKNFPNGAVLLFDRNLRYLIAEGVELANAGLSNKLLEGRTLRETFAPQVCETFEPMYQKALLGEASFCEYPYEHRILAVHVLPVTNEQGEIFAGMVMTQDITAQKSVLKELRQQAEREQLVGAIAARIRHSLDLQEVLNTTVTEVRQVLQTDRVLFYRTEPGYKGVVVESTGANCTPIMGTSLSNTCFVDDYVPKYQQGWIQTIEDIHTVGLKQCQVDLLEQFQVKASLVVPVLQGKKLWGLIFAHHCRGTRQWQASEILLLRQLSVHMAIALHQAELYQQLCTELAERSAAEAALRQSEALLREQATQLEQALFDLRQTQAKLIQSEKMSSLGQLVAGVAHEINNPVTFITGNLIHASQYARDLLHLLQLYHLHYPQPVPQIQAEVSDIDLDFLVEDFPKLLDSMNVGADRIRQIVLSLRNFCRLDESECKPVDLHEGLDNTLLILQHRLKPQGNNPGIQVIKEYGDLPWVECYAGGLNQVFMNLLSNAIDALEVRSQEVRSSESIIRIHTEVLDGKRVVVRIADNGCGIPEAIQQRIFDPFFTTKPVGRGTGLGLSISYQIVFEKHRGQMHCHSKPGQGTEFIVEIPLRQSAEGTNQMGIQKSTRFS